MYIIKQGTRSAKSQLDLLGEGKLKHEIQEQLEKTEDDSVPEKPVSLHDWISDT